jgi:carboxymethylenebutenolidase
MTTEEAAAATTPPSFEDTSFPSASGRPMKAALALPAGDQPRPAVIVIHEAFGLNRDIREKTARVAAMGYVALAPDLFDKPAPKPICIARTLRQVGKGQGEALDDLEAARAWLADQPYVDGSRIGVMGFCMGGAFALLLASQAPLAAAAPFYGQAPADSDEASPYERMCPVVASYGGRDRFLRGVPKRLDEALERHDIDHEVSVYPDAGHSYMSDHKGIFAKIGSWGPMKLGFRPEAAEDSWQRVEAFFGKHLG